ncbi:MAG TPA: polysaccharide biosynthesis/export family protein [Coleofasciculaceae cyanobacterium]
MTGLTLLTLITLADSKASMAQLPDFGSTVPVRLNSNLAQAEQDYTLGAGDRIRIDILQVPQFSGEQEILVNGTLNLPQVGRLSVEGMTLEQAQQAIAAKYARILRRPIVTITVLAPRPLRIGVAGEIIRPGTYTMTRQDSQFPTITQALKMAGGITQAADLRNVQVRRSQRLSSGETINVDLLQLLETGDLGNDITLRDGDTIYVPTASNINVAEASQLVSTSFSAEANKPLNIVVIGEVFRPGPYTVTGTARTGAAGGIGAAGGGDVPPTATRAIQVAGGITPRADIRRIEIRRSTKTGSELTISVNLWELLQTGDARQDAILQEGDTVFVPAAAEIDPAEATQIATASFSPDTIIVNVVGEVPRPGAIQIPPNTPLNQALLTAGGFNNRARKSSVELVRLNINGTVERRTVEIDFAKGVNDQTNPALRNNDVIIVGRSTLASVSDTLDTAIGPLGRFLTILNFPLNLFRLF